MVLELVVDKVRLPDHSPNLLGTGTDDWDVIQAGFLEGAKPQDLP